MLPPAVAAERSLIAGHGGAVSDFSDDVRIPNAPHKYHQKASSAASALSRVSGPAQARNVVIFVADGLRSHAVTPVTSPALAAVRDQGVDFANSHSLYPTVTTPNSSAIATGHLLGDTGDFGNTIYVGAPFGAPFGSSLAAVEDDVMLGLLNKRFGGNWPGRRPARRPPPALHGRPRPRPWARTGRSASRTSRLATASPRSSSTTRPLVNDEDKPLAST